MELVDGYRSLGTVNGFAGWAVGSQHCVNGRLRVEARFDLHRCGCRLSVLALSYPDPATP